MFWLSLLVACGPDAVAPSGGPPVLHRLTEVQINQSLRDLFRDRSLPTVALPRDVPVHGFDNNALTRDATPYLVESLQRDMIDLTEVVARRGGAWLLCTPEGGSDPIRCGHDTLAQTMQRAWRRPATDDELRWVHGLFDEWLKTHGFSTALQLSLQVVLQSPEFLHLVETGSNGRLTDWEIASKLSYFLWDSMPDETLFELAAAGRLQDRAVVREQARRLLSHPRSRDSVARYHRQWLGFEHIETIDPDPDLLAGAGDDEEEVGAEVNDLRFAYQIEFDRFVQGAVFGVGTLDALMTSRETWVSDLTAQIYGVEPTGPGESVSRPVGNLDIQEITVYPATLDPRERAGFLTTGAFLAGHSHALQPSPVLRSVFLRERLLCIDAVPPPDDVPPLEDTEAVAWTTNRERYAQHTEQPACAACHVAIDGTGFPFESYDAVGAYRTQDNGAPVDASGELYGTDVDRPVDGAVDLIETLAGSQQLYDCAVTNWYRYAMHRTETAADEAALRALQARFWSDGGVIPDLLVAIATSDAFLSAPLGSQP